MALTHASTIATLGELRRCSPALSLGCWRPTGHLIKSGGIAVHASSRMVMALVLLTTLFLGSAERPTVAQTPAPLTIGAVQGRVSATADGGAARSPYAPINGNGNGQIVTVSGVIHGKTLARTSSGGSNFGFFIQNPPTTADGDPETSDGIFVFIGRFATLRRDGGGSYTPQTGDEVVLRGPVAEFFNLTQIVNPFLVQVIRGGVNLDAELPPFDTNPPADLVEAQRYWERREGMRARVPARSIVIDGRDVFPSTADGEVWLAHPDNAIARRADPYARRAFRDPHPLDDIPGQAFDNGNGYRIVLGSLGVKAAANDSAALIAPARTFDMLTNAPVGGVYFSFNKYQVMVEQQLTLAAGADPSRNAQPRLPDRDREYSIATFNVENLYDVRDDPFDGCDFTGNGGCPGVSPPFDYVPASDAAYQARLSAIARQIITDLHAPDILLIQEAEDQDICAATATALTCGSANNADGKPDTLQDLARAIAVQGGPAYDAAYDRDGADDRGIVSAFLYRTDRVQLLPAQADDPVLSSSPRVVYRSPGLPANAHMQNPKALNAALPADVDTSTGVDGVNVFTRAPQVALFRVWRDRIGASVFADLYAISNHFSSGPTTRIGQRREQAAYNAVIVAAVQTAHSGARVVVGGDLNVFPRPDDPFAPGEPLFPSDQLAPLYARGLTNLWDRLVAEAPASAYSYVFQGQAQTLDQLFVTSALRDEVTRVRAAHINADWPADFDGDGARGVSDHDPQVAHVSLVPTLDRLEALVQFFDGRGDITGNNTARILLDRIDRARRFAASGQEQASRSQIKVFIEQLDEFKEKRLSRPAAGALKHEAEYLREGGK